MNKKQAIKARQYSPKVKGLVNDKISLNDNQKLIRKKSRFRLKNRMIYVIFNYIILNIFILSTLIQKIKVTISSPESNITL